MTQDHAPGLAIVLEFFFVLALTALLFSALLPLFVKVLDKRETSQLRGIRNLSGIFVAVFGASMAYAMPTHLLNQVCLTPTWIYIQDGADDHFRSRPWTDVSTVTTSCWNRKGWGGAMDLGLRDGKVIALNSKTSGETWSEYLPKVAKALHGHDFKFDASQVGPSCRAPGAAMLRTRP